MDSNYLTQAILECEEVLETKSENPETWQTAFRNLGNFLQGTGQFERAIVWHSLALEQQPSLAEIYCQLGELYIAEELWSEALKAFENALEHQPNSVQIYANLAQIHGRLQQREAEMDCWYRATQINPELVNPKGYYKLAKAFEQKGKIEEAISCYQRASKSKELFVIANYDLGEIYLRQRKLELAEATYQKVAVVAPNEAKSQYKLGTIYLQRQNFEKAIECFRQTIQNAPDFPFAYRDLVKTFLKLKKWDEAIATCYGILNLVEEYPWVYVQLGNALRGKGRIAEAAANFQKACQVRGWEECVERDYFFTQDIFSYRIPLWETHLKFLFDLSEIKILEIGSYEGMSACWFLDRILTHTGDRLTCIEKKFHPKLRENIVKTGAESKVDLLEGDVSQFLDALAPDSFDAINMQDKHKTADVARENAASTWKALKTGGVVVFNDYGWRNPRYPEQNPQQGIDSFLNSIQEQWELVHKNHSAFQLIVRKI